MTVTVDEGLVEQVQEALGARTRSEAVRLALREVLRRRRLARVLAHRGAVELDLDQEGLQALRDPS